MQGRSIALSLAIGLRRAGCAYTATYPGSSAQWIAEKVRPCPMAVSERVAFGLSYGASMAGIRSMVSFKSYGFNVAADEFVASMSTGVNAGLVVCVVDDTEVAGSQGRFDSRAIQHLSGGLIFEPGNAEQGYEIGLRAHAISERLDIPVVVRLTTRAMQGLATAAEQKDDMPVQPPHIAALPLPNSPTKWLRHPWYWRAQAERIAARRTAIEAFVDSAEAAELAMVDYPSEETSLASGASPELVVTQGDVEQELQSHAERGTPRRVFRSCTYPPPSAALLRAVKEPMPSKITVLEQGEPHAFHHVQRVLGQHLSSAHRLTLTSHTGTTPDNSHLYWNDRKLERLFSALRAVTKPSSSATVIDIDGYVVGDVTSFTKESCDAIDSCLSLGSALPVAAGVAEVRANAVGERPCHVFAVSGDASLAHNGGASLVLSIAARGPNLRVGLVVVDNGGSQSTGGQTPPGGCGYASLAPSCAAAGIPLRLMDYAASSAADFAAALRQMRAANGLQVLIVKY